MKQFLINPLRFSLPALLLLLIITGCRGYVDFLPQKGKPKPEEPKCRVSFVWFYLSNGIKGDTTFYHYDNRGNLAYASRVIHRIDGTLTRFSGEGQVRAYDANGMIQAITFPDNKTIIRYIYDNKKPLRAEMLENGIVVQTFAVNYDSKGRVKESIGSGRLNNQRVVYTYNQKDQVTNVDRFDQAGNRVSWDIFTDFDPNVKFYFPAYFPAVQVPFTFINPGEFAGFSNSPFGQPSARAAYRRGQFYAATDVQGNYNGVTRLLGDQYISFVVNSKGYIKERRFEDVVNKFQGTGYTEYSNCD